MNDTTVRQEYRVAWEAWHVHTTQAGINVESWYGIGQNDDTFEAE